MEFFLLEKCRASQRLMGTKTGWPRILDRWILICMVKVKCCVGCQRKCRRLRTILDKQKGQNRNKGNLHYAPTHVLRGWHGHLFRGQAPKFSTAHLMLQPGKSNRKWWNTFLQHNRPCHGQHLMQKSEHLTQGVAWSNGHSLGTASTIAVYSTWEPLLLAKPNEVWPYPMAYTAHPAHCALPSLAPSHPQLHL